MANYKLRAELYGHSKDVRGVCEGYFPSENMIISSSRDESVRIWNVDESGCYVEKHQLRAHNGFVPCVISFRPYSKFPNGLIFSGGHDHKIGVHAAGPTPELLYMLEGHTATVCSLAVDERSGLLISGSWDATARIWDGQECVSVLSGHKHTVWAVAVLPLSKSEIQDTPKCPMPRILTGSADKKIILWNMGKPEKSFDGHTDCVRSLAVLSESEFLSAANDCTIRRWNLHTGVCTMVYHGHENFVYSMSLIPTDKDLFVTSSEDGTVKIWRISTGDNVQTLLFPTSTIWAVCSLSNGDIVVGSSDGAIRVFSNDPKRQADPDSIAAYDHSVQTYYDSLQSKDTIGGYKIADLPGKEVLNEPGFKDGQTKMVRSGRNVELHKWTEQSGQWEKVGDVMGAAEPAPGKMMFNGKEYDYVFDIDVEEGKPPLKLPYNIVEDPWAAAHRFLEQNMLPMAYIDQVAQFINTNAKDAGVGAPPAAHSDPFTGGARYVPGSGVGGQVGNVSDPFTGSGRYVPGSQATNGVGQAGAVDPFTGAGRYVPGGGAIVAPSGDAKNLDPRRPRGEHMPLTEFVKFTSVSTESLLAKLMEFNQKQSDVHLRLNDEQILLLEEFTLPAGSPSVKATDAHIKSLEQALQWHKDYLVPVLDIFRLAILNNTINNHFFSDSRTGRGPATVDSLCRLFAAVDSPPQFQILVCRSLANAMAGGETGRRLLIGQNCSTAVVPLVAQCLDSPKAAAHVASSAALANFSCAYLSNGKNMDTSSTKIDCFRLLIENLKHARKGIDYGSLAEESVFRILQALVTFMWGDDTTLAIARALNISDLVARLKDATNEERSKTIARSIERMIG